MDEMTILEENKNFTLSEDINGSLLAAVIGLEIISGFFSNSFILVLTVCYLKTWKQPSNIFLTNMLLNNLIIVVIVAPFSIITCATGEWIFGSTLSEKVATCEASAYFLTFGTLVALESLVLISFDRFFFIVKSFEYKKYMTMNKAIIVVTMSWILAAILISTPLYGFGNYRFSNSYGMCVPNFRNLGYAAYGSISSLVLILSIIVTSTWTYCYTRRYIKRKSSSATLRNNSNEYQSQNRKLIGLFGTLIIIHVLCYTLFIAVSAVRPFFVAPRQLWATTFVLVILMPSLSPIAHAYFRYDVRSFLHGLSMKMKGACTCSCARRTPATQKETIESFDTSVKTIHEHNTQLSIS